MARQPMRHECDVPRETRWYLMVDRDRFHVYVGAQVEGMRGRLRIDWHDNSQLELRWLRHGFDRDAEAILIGTTRNFCKACLVERVKSLHMQHYQIFRFNCRTVTYLILTRVYGFDKQVVYDHFVNGQIMCGLDESECVSLNELHHYLNWSETQGRPMTPLPCVIF